MIGLLSHSLLERSASALTLFALITMLWLAISVVLHADRRTFGSWIAAGGLLLCAVFLLAYRLILGGSLALPPGWWRVCLLLSVAAPLLWYLGMLAYADRIGADRQRLSVAIVGLSGLALLIAAGVVPAAAVAAMSVPLAGYAAACFGLSALTLLRAAPSAHPMGALAQRRAQPWLLSVLGVLLLIDLLVNVALARWARLPIAEIDDLRAMPEWPPLHLLGVLLVTIATTTIGQAIVRYEIFTGKLLPRRNLRRAWQIVLALAALYALLIGGMLAPSIAGTIAGVLFALAIAVVGWYGTLERQRAIDRLRPLVAGLRLYDRLLDGDRHDLAHTFDDLCKTVLRAQSAVLLPSGPLASLVAAPLVYPPRPIPPSLATIGDEPIAASPHTLCVAVEPRRYGGARWAVPLWSERGQIGVLLLGPHRDGDLYSQESIEIARATGERLIDALASLETTRRLIDLQRRRLTVGQVLDRRTRRALHDDVLPQLHTALLLLSADRQADSQITPLLVDAHRQISDLLRDMPPAPTHDLRDGPIAALRHAEELSAGFDEVHWQIEPRAAAARPPDVSAEVLYYAAREAIRNAARYGRGDDSARPLRLAIRATADRSLAIQIEDDGVGVGATGRSGGGHGLALHSTLLAIVGGTLSVERLAHGTRITIALPLTDRPAPL